MPKNSIEFKDDGTVEAIVPNCLYMMVVKVQAAENLDWERACARVAELADSGSEKFSKKVKEEARKIHNREFMTQFNRARLTIEQNAREVVLEHAKIRHPCPGCGKDIVWDLLNPEARKQIMGILDRGGIDSWHHSGCNTQNE